ncbi:PREDICTED: Sjoegren syndrome/scleroderma autoantigen 1 homolog [Amphimedon queenslandica]|uniref:Uncharacterized protein n=1 Tax=Amphimedon queenslandica TaxID=400682 RepID=A0A1X7UL63_AMPQE|nr:PREDICTED: Sjoegren syndrome/scleroderma autoantigen 1 homolog [Amphimedon queenslandica]|eukprot:XP_019853701.1 PREDICTED: Sjoegren syndrome/scleroderma autoantigen 1 homolog [Amphimedon queenslandica]
MASTAFSPALRDQAASLIGQYLLQGYRMLAEHCGECTTVLVQKQRNKPLCVLCEELLPERKTQTLTSTTDISKTDNEEPDSTACHGGNPPSPTPLPALPPLVITDDDAKGHTSIEGVREILLKKMTVAARQLETSQSVEYSSHLCQLIRECANTIKSLKDI